MTIADPCSFPARPEPGASHAFVFLIPMVVDFYDYHDMPLRLGGLKVETITNINKGMWWNLVPSVRICWWIWWCLLTQRDCDFMTVFRALMIFAGSSSAENMVQMDHLLSKLMLPAVAMCLCILQPCRLCASFRSSKVCSRDYSLIIQVESVYCIYIN